MPFDWTNFLRLAEELARRADEASKRTAISRAYYSVFNSAFARAEATAGRFQSGQNEGSHQWCWNKYMRTPDAACRKLGLTGDRMKALRVQADYNPADIARLDDVVQRLLEEARKFRSDLATLNARYPLP